MLASHHSFSWRCRLSRARRLITVFAAFGLGEAAARAPAEASGDKGQLVLTFFELRDIGRGSGLALVVQTPAGATWLYDAGLSAQHWTDSDIPKQWPPLRIDWDAGRDAIVPFLKEHRISEIDGIVISHPHADHYGGAFHLIQNLRVRALIDNGYEGVGMSSEYRSLRRLIQDRGGRLQTARAGDRLDWGSGLDVEVLWPPAGLVTEKDVDFKRAAQAGLVSANDRPMHFFPNVNSLVLRIRHGRNVFLLPGDLHALGSDRLLGCVSADRMKATVLAAPGHGIHPQRALAAAVKPDVVVVSSLPRYSNPNAAKIYGEELGARVYLTYRNGRIQITSDGETFAVNTER